MQCSDLQCFKILSLESLLEMNLKSSITAGVLLPGLKVQLWEKLTLVTE